MTLDLYAHVLNDTLTRAADMMAKSLADAADVEPLSVGEPVENAEGSEWARRPRSSCCSMSSQWP